jgi:dsRNA-specific ribonuclease
MTRLQQIHTAISALLKRAEIPDHICGLLLSPQNLPQFDRALTHESYDKHCNYEFFEFIGDSIINLEVALFVYRHFTLQSAGAATIIKHQVQSNKLLGEIAEKYGLVQLLLRVPREKDDEAKIKGDVMESIMGCLFLLTSEVRMDCTAKLLCSKILGKLLEECNLHQFIDPENCKDSVTTFKEEYQDHYRWPPIKKLFRTTKLADEMVYAELYGVIDGRMVKLSDAQSNDVKAAKKITASRAMEMLKTRYGLFGKSRANEDLAPERGKAPQKPQNLQNLQMRQERSFGIHGRGAPPQTQPTQYTRSHVPHERVPSSAGSAQLPRDQRDWEWNPQWGADQSVQSSVNRGPTHVQNVRYVREQHTERLASTGQREEPHADPKQCTPHRSSTQTGHGHPFSSGQDSKKVGMADRMSGAPHTTRLNNTHQTNTRQNGCGYTSSTAVSRSKFDTWFV